METEGRYHPEMETPEEGDAIEVTSDAPQKDLETEMPQMASVGTKGRFGLGGFDRGKASAYLGSRYEGREVFALDDRRNAAIVDPATGAIEAVFPLPSPDELARSAEERGVKGSSYTIPRQNIRPVEAINDEATKKLLADFRYHNADERQTLQRTNRERRDRRQVFDTLHAVGAVEERDGVMVWDFDKLKTITTSRSSGWSEAGNVAMNRHDVYELLQNEQGVSRNDFEQAKREGRTATPRPLFWQPRSLDEAFDPAAIRADQSYGLGSWDIGDRKFMSKWSQNVVLPSGEKAPLNELFLAKKIFGDARGRRDAAGHLQVWDEAEGKERLFSATWFSERFGFSGGGLADGPAGSRALSSPTRYLIEQAPHLIEHGLLAPEDFRTQREKGGSLVRRQGGPIQSNAQAYINGATYYLGAEFDTRKRPDAAGRYTVVELSPALAGVIEMMPDGTSRVSHTFQFKSTDEIEARKHEILAQAARGEIKAGNTAAGYITFGKHRGVKVLPYHITGDNQRFSGETPEAYAERIRLISRFDFIEKLSTEFSTKAGIGIHDVLSWREQQWLATAINEIPGSKEKVMAGTKKYGVDFLKSFLVTEQGLEHGRDVMAGADTLPAEQASQLFAKYRELSEAVESVDDYLDERFAGQVTDDQRRIIHERLLRQARNSITDVVRQPTPEAMASALDHLEAVRANVAVFAATFRELSRHQPVDLATLQHTSLETLDGAAVPAADRRAMVELHRANRLGYSPDLLASTTADLEKSFDSPANRVHVLRDEQSMISFARFEDQPDGSVYAGALNVAPGGKNSGLGSAFFAETLRHEGHDKEIIAVVKADNPMLKHYLDDFGFEITGTDENYHQTGQKFYQLRRRWPAEGAQRQAA